MGIKYLQFRNLHKMQAYKPLKKSLSDEASIGVKRLGVNKISVASYGQGLTGQKSTSCGEY
jgi:hypothetical protein